MRIDQIPLVLSEPNITIESIVLSTVQFTMNVMGVMISPWAWRQWIYVTDKVFHAVHNSHSLELIQ